MKKSILSALMLGMAVLPSACQQADTLNMQEPVQPGAPQTADWNGFVNGFLDGYMPLHPDFAVGQGKHEYDGQLPDWTEAGIARQIDFLKQEIAGARAIAPQGLTDAQRFERNYLIAVAQGQLFWLEDADWPHRNPAYYVGSLDPNVYIARPYADKATRMRAFITYATNVPVAAAQIKANLKGPLPLSYINYGVAGFGGFAEFFTGDAKAAFADVEDPALQDQFSAAAGKAALAMQGVADFLEAKRPQATQDFALGADRFARMLSRTEMVDVPLDQLEAIGRADLKRNQDALKTACARFAPGASIQDCVGKMALDKPADGPVAEARRQLPTLRAFIETNDIVSIPGTEQAQVEESPPYNRQNSAYIDIPGPYETGLPSVYYISPPDPELGCRQARGLYSRQKGPAVHLGARGMARPFPQFPARQPRPIDVWQSVRRLCLRGRVGALYRGNDVGRRPQQGRPGNAYRPAVQRAAARLPFPVRDRHARPRHDDGAIEADVPEPVLSGRRQCRPAGGARHL